MSQVDSLSALRQLKIFFGFSDPQIAELCAGFRMKTCTHREALYNAGDEVDSFSLVVQGAFKLVKSSPHGQEFIVHFATPGDAIGALLMAKPDVMKFPLTARAMGFSVVCIIPRKTYSDVWAKNADIQSRLNSLLYHRMSQIHDDKTLSRAPLSVRIASFFVNTLERSGASDGKTIPLPLTRQEIADTLGVTVESVIRAMSTMSQQGLIKTQDKHIEILKIDEMIHLMGSAH